MPTATPGRAARNLLRSALAVAAGLGVGRDQARRPSIEGTDAVARLAGQVATFDPDLARDSARLAGRIVCLAAYLEHELDGFCLLEARLRRVICRVEAVTDQSEGDELFADLAGWLGILRVRPALEQLATAHPDLGRRSTVLAFSSDHSPAA
jgi:hypothetical protein